MLIVSLKGARRLNTVLEKVLEEYSYNASKYKGTTVTVVSIVIVNVIVSVIIVTLLIIWHIN
jgi:ATP-dependent protease HslVU (ClpYQ) ATPase subunit